MDIDYVVPMVFPDDVLWQRDFENVGRNYREGHVRWRSWGTEHKLIRLVRKNMPFVRNVIILLSRESQVQSWMKEEEVRVVFHRDFIPKSFLPLFNSRSIEMFLKNIPDLSEHFLYGNDDMFPISTLEEEDFFVEGKPCLHMKEKVYPEEPNNFQRACMKGLNFSGKEFGLRFKERWLKNGHSIAPILKSTCEHLWEIGKNEIESSISKFREPYNFNQYIYSWWQYFSGSYVDRLPRIKYVSVRNTLDDILAALKSDVQILCINDNECLKDYERYSIPVRDAIESL